MNRTVVRDIMRGELGYDVRHRLHHQVARCLQPLLSLELLLLMFTKLRLLTLLMEKRLLMSRTVDALGRLVLVEDGRCCPSLLGEEGLGGLPLPPPCR